MRAARVLVRAASLRAALAAKPLYSVQPMALRTAMATFSTAPAPAAAAAATEEEEEEEEEEEDGPTEEENYDQALLEYFTELDAADAAKAVPVKPLPVKVSGLSGEFAGDLYRNGIKAENFGAIIDDIAGINAVVADAPDLVSRFFQHANYSPEECNLVVSLLTTDAVKTYDAVKNQDLREIVLGSAENVKSWLDARAEFASLDLEPATQDLLKKLANIARLDLLPYIYDASMSLYSAESKTIPVTVASAVALNDEQKKRITSLLPKYAGSTAALDIAFEVEPSTLGGLLITLDSRSIDLTASTQLMETIQEYN